MAKVYIGCSGYLYPHWRGGVFYPKGLAQKEEFSYYASIFNTVELNSTFYRLPKENVWDSWQKRAPQGFIYSVKMNRFLTHIKKLNEPKEAWEQFYNGARKLQDHLGPILFQLPPSLHKNQEKLAGLSKVLPKNLRFAFEFRDVSWFDEKIYEILRENNWALTIISHPDLPFIPALTADFTYLRFHGKEALYSSEYSESKLKEFAKMITDWLKTGVDVYAYFNNDLSGFAPKNALTLSNFLSDKTCKIPEKELE